MLTEYVNAAVAKGQPPELRHTVLAQVAFHDLQAMGLDAFLAQNNGEGWMLPKTLRLSDYGLGHDDRAKTPVPVSPLLGPRFLPSQLNEDVAQSWEECRRHAENIRAIRSRFAPEPAAAPASTPASPPAPSKPTALDLLGQPIPTDLFGNEITCNAPQNSGQWLSKEPRAYERGKQANSESGGEAAAAQR